MPAKAGIQEIATEWRRILAPRERWGKHRSGCQPSLA
jgi:hypothetical protein